MEALLTLFDSLTDHLRQLTELAKRKTTAVRMSDLTELDKILKEEQAQSLAMRGIDQKRVSLLSQYGLENVPLAALPAKLPPEWQQQAREAAEALRSEYTIYQSAAEIARNTLECNLHEVEKFLAAAGAAADGGAGYRNSDVDAPPQMKADFRA